MLPVETEFRAREMELRSFILQNISSGPLYTSLCRMLGAFADGASRDSDPPEAPRKGGGLQQQDGRKEKGWGSWGSDPRS